MITPDEIREEAEASFNRKLVDSASKEQRTALRIAADFFERLDALTVQLERIATALEATEHTP